MLIALQTLLKGFIIKQKLQEQTQMKNLTEKQLSTLLLVQQVNEIVKTNTLNGEQLTEKFDTPVKVYNSLCENDPYDTLEIFKDIYELSKLGYIKTTLKEEDLTIEKLSSLLASEDLKIRETSVTERGLYVVTEYIKEAIGYEEGKYSLEELKQKISELLKSDTWTIIKDGVIPTISLVTTIIQMILC